MSAVPRNEAGQAAERSQGAGPIRREPIADLGGMRPVAAPMWARLLPAARQRLTAIPAMLRFARDGVPPLREK